MIRFIRASLRFSMPKARLNQIFKRSSQQIYNVIIIIIIIIRSSQQIYNVTLFFVFFWVLYGLLGVQFFGDLHSHCVREHVNSSKDVTINDLTIPDSYCR